MRRVSAGRLACMLAVMLLAPLVHAKNCSEPVLVPDEPVMSHFANYETFLIEALEYKAAKRKRRHHREVCPLAYLNQNRPNPNPTVVTSPETLAEAFQRAEKMPHLNYAALGARGPSTARNIPLPDIEGDKLASKRLGFNLKMFRAEANPKVASKVLQGSFTQNLSAARTNGAYAQYWNWLYPELLLPGQTHEAREVAQSTSGGLLASLAFIYRYTNQTRLTIYIGTSGKPLRITGAAYGRMPGS